MCMLTVIPAGHVPSVDGIYNGTLTNNDGHGFAIVLPRRVMVYHDMNAERAIERFDKARRAHPKGPALFHSRWATHGRIDESNCHPFKVGGDKKTVLAHNGVLSNEAHPGKGDPRSDTKKYAQEIYPRRFAHSMDSLLGRKAHEAWLGNYNKVAVITANPRYSESLYILNEAKGLWSQDGNWYSNNDYLPYVPKAKASSVITADDWSPSGGWAYWDGSASSYDWSSHGQTIGGKPAVLESSEAEIRADIRAGEMGRWPGVCPWCYESDAINHISGTCERCNTCLDCIEPLSTCFCYPVGGEHGRVKRHSFHNYRESCN